MEETIVEQSEKQTAKEWILKRCPKFSLVIFFICFIAVCIHITCVISTSFADFYNQNIGAFFRVVLAYLTKYLPFSLAETIIIALPAILFLMIYISVKMIKRSDNASIRCIVGLFSVLTLMYSIFVLGYGMGYHGSTLAKKLDLEEKPVTASELKYTAETILGEMEGLLDGVQYANTGSSVMPYSLDEMNKKLNQAYKKATEKYGFIQDLNSNIKYIVLSEPMTYTHISGVYSYYTGEANLNINFPDYTLPFTAAHEFAHQRGIAPENEANFVAFLVCMESDDPYIKYCGYMNMFDYVTNALYSASPEMYYEVFAKTDTRIVYEMVGFGNFFAKYRESTASEVADVVNDTYLKVQGQTNGTASYGMVVDLAVAYYKQK